MVSTSSAVAINFAVALSALQRNTQQAHSVNRGCDC